MTTSTCAACGSNAEKTTATIIREIDFTERSDASDEVELCDDCLAEVSAGFIIYPKYARRVGDVEWSFIDLVEEPA